MALKPTPIDTHEVWSFMGAEIVLYSQVIIEGKFVCRVLYHDPLKDLYFKVDYDV